MARGPTPAVKRKIVKKKLTKFNRHQGDQFKRQSCDQFKHQVCRPSPAAHHHAYTSSRQPLSLAKKSGAALWRRSLLHRLSASTTAKTSRRTRIYARARAGKKLAVLPALATCHAVAVS